MSEYIDKDALYKDFLLLEDCKRELAKEKEVDEYTFLKRQWSLRYAVYYRQFVANFPTADVAHVIHGKNLTECNPVDEFICSHCGAIFRDVALCRIDEDNGDETYYEFES